jgi:hypothetical protein
LDFSPRKVVNLVSRRSEPLLGTLSRLRAIDGAFTRAVFGRDWNPGTLVDLRGSEPARRVGGFGRLAAFSSDGQVLVHEGLYEERIYPVREANPRKERMVFRRAPGWEVVGQVPIPKLSRQVEARPLQGGREIVIVAENGAALIDVQALRARTLYVPYYTTVHALSADARTLALVDRRDKKTVKIWRLADGPGKTP